MLVAMSNAVKVESVPLNFTQTLKCRLYRPPTGAWAGANGSGGSVAPSFGATVLAGGPGRPSVYLRASAPVGPAPLTIRSAPTVVLVVANLTPVPANGANDAIWL